MSPEVHHEVRSQRVDEGVLIARHSILDKFILASTSFGLLASLVALWRDLSTGIFLSNSIINIASAVLLGILWFIRRRLSIEVKSLVVFVLFLSLAIKNVWLFGPHSGGIVFLAFACIIPALVLEVKWTIVISLILSLLIPIRAYLHFSGLSPVDQDFDSLLASVPTWATLYSFFLLIGFIVAFGIGQLRSELNWNFQLLREAVKDLQSTNEKLTREIELKTIYEEGLEMSNRKFQSLFEGSRDGVLLMNSKARIIEANAAALAISGFTLEELRSVSVFDFLEEPFRKPAQDRFELNMEGNMLPQLTEVRIITKEGKAIPVEINSNLILGEDELMILSTVRDISYRKQAENEKFNAALAAEEKERERFSRDLHDDLGPVFSTLNLYLQTLSSKESDPAKKAILNDLSGIVDSAVKQVREISHNLSPYLLREAGLVEAIRTHLKNFTFNRIQTDFDVTPHDAVSMPQATQIVLYRVFLELLNNTLKHAKANEIQIQLRQRDSEVSFSYSDNGIGYDPSLTVNSGIGLKNIENRVNALNGILEFKSHNNRITTIVKIPI